MICKYCRTLPGQTKDTLFKQISSKRSWRRRRRRREIDTKRTVLQSIDNKKADKSFTSINDKIFRAIDKEKDSVKAKSIYNKKQESIYRFCLPDEQSL